MTFELFERETFLQRSYKRTLDSDARQQGNTTGSDISANSFIPRRCTMRAANLTQAIVLKVTYRNHCM